MESKKYNKPVNPTKEKQTPRHRGKGSGYQRGEGRKKGDTAVPGEGRKYQLWYTMSYPLGFSLES